MINFIKKYIFTVISFSMVMNIILVHVLMKFGYYGHIDSLATSFDNGESVVQCSWEMLIGPYQTRF